MCVTRLNFYTLLLFFSLPLFAAPDEPILLPPDVAFKVAAHAVSSEQVDVSWQIAPGYYLYQAKFHLTAQPAQVQLGKFDFPPAESKQDENFGEMLVYHKNVTLTVPVINPTQQSSFQLLVSYQGCAEAGVCYPPQKKTLDVTLPAALPAKANPLSQLSNGLQGLKASFAKPELLPAEQAFQFFSAVKNPTTLHLNWLLADGYYLYREKIKLTLNSQSMQLGAYEVPRGTPKHDEAFGDVEIFHNELSFDVPLLRTGSEAEAVSLTVSYQGCADRGVCYPPMEKTVQLDLPALSSKTTAAPLSEQDQIVKSLHQDSLGLSLLTFLGFGILLSLTPCVFPMVPILSGIIIGQGKNISTGKAFGLSLSYVLATALTYTVFGVLAALFGSNLQATFQQPWVIGLFSGIFVALAFSMFGFYHLELPTFLRAKLHQSSDKHRDGSYLGAAMMGSLSSLIVGPCVAAPLAGALIYIGKTGDVVLGGSALFMMGFGMGTPLLLIGASAGKLLPRAGHWLNAINPVFGVIMLGVALWMLDRILPAPLMMVLWAMLLVIPAIYLSAIDPLPHPSSGWRKLWKGLGVMMLVYGVILLIGVSLGNTNPLQPLQGTLSASYAAGEKKTGLTFIRIKSLAELQQQLQAASEKKQPVMLDFYADWCISCKEMEAYTFTNAKVKQKLDQFVLLQADVTANTAEDQALLKQFNLVGPPAILFFGTDRQEQAQYRVIGYQEAETFLAGIANFGTKSP